jgi:hypothetical protein
VSFADLFTLTPTAAETCAGNAVSNIETTATEITEREANLNLDI